MNHPSSNPIGKWLCRMGIHKFRVVEVKFSFGATGRVEILECQRCGETQTRKAK